jgi:hypothetical protein
LVLEATGARIMRAGIAIFAAMSRHRPAMTVFLGQRYSRTNQSPEANDPGAIFDPPEPPQADQLRPILIALDTAWDHRCHDPTRGDGVDYLPPITGG